MQLQLNLKESFLQGHFIIGITEPGSKIILDKKELKKRWLFCFWT